MKTLTQQVAEATVIKESTRFNYSGHGWEGKNYQGDLSIKEIAERVRKILKGLYPECKFSVTKESFAGGRALNVTLVSAPYQVFAEPSTEECICKPGYGTAEEKLEYWKDTIKSGHHQVNQYYINDDYKLTEKAKEIMTVVNKLSCSYNFDDSDSMSDYFHTNFYFHLSIGKWNKPFEVK